MAQTYQDRPQRIVGNGLATTRCVLPFGLQAGLTNVSTPLRAKEPVLVRYGWESDGMNAGSADPAWEFRYLASSGTGVEQDRVYVTADGSQTRKAPVWASA